MKSEGKQWFKIVELSQIDSVSNPWRYTIHARTEVRYIIAFIRNESLFF